MAETYYSIEWCSSSYRRHGDGFITHAVARPGDGRALCGVYPDDCGGGEVPQDGEPGCIRCRKALRKLGVIDAGKTTYVHLDEKQVVKCNTADANKHPIIASWYETKWAKSVWVTDSALAVSRTSISSPKMLAQALEIIATTEPITA